MQNIAGVLIIMAAAMRARVMGASGARAHQMMINRLHAVHRRNASSYYYCCDNNILAQTYASSALLGSNSNMAFVSTLSSLREARISNNHFANQRPNRCQLRQSLPIIASRRHRSSSQMNDADIGEFFANPETFPDFSSLGVTSPALLDRLSSPPNSLRRPSAVQAAAYEIISGGQNNVIVGAETGSGKTLAYLLPLVEDILKRKREWKAKMDNVENGESGDQIIDPGYDYARAVVLVPNKELAHQAVRMAASICGGLDKCVIWGAEALGIDHNRFPSEGDIAKEEDIVRLAILPGGLNAPKDFPPFRFATSSSSSHQRQPPPDLVFTTPANLGPMALSPKHIDFFADVSTLVVDEADMLLDGGYIRQLNNVLMGFRRADRLLDKYDSISFHHKSDDNNDDQSDSIEDEDMERKEQKKTQHVFVAATLPDYGLRSVDAYLKRKFPDAVNVTMAGMHNARHYGLEDESITVWNEIEDNQERMQRLVDVLRLDRSEVGVDGRGLKGEKVMVFLNTVNDVDGASNALRRAGIDAVPYHAKIGLEDRTSNLDKFRRYHAPSDGNGDDTNNNGKNTVPVLVCTDVASRGLDIPGVTAIIQLQFAQNVVAHLHRMGRCGRAGNQDGRGIVFYGSKQRELVEVVREAEEQQSRMTLIQDVEDELDDCGLESDGKSAKTEIGKVEKAFSRKRGFTKKRKKQRKRAREVTEG